VRLLLIEDDRPLGKALFEGLKEEYACDWFRSAEEGKDALEAVPYDMIVLDINLPGISGIDWLTRLRKAENTIPVLLLTARGAHKQRVQGLDAGADDYLTKPFDFEELLARIRALLRRRGVYQGPIIKYKNISVDVTGSTVLKNGETVALSSKEFEIFRVLAENIGRCLSKNQIEQKIYDWSSEFESNTVEVHISSIRRKLGKDIIKTIRGIGYIMERET
jgi:DNA-binding response OmpR family regulator